VYVTREAIDSTPRFVASMKARSEVLMSWPLPPRLWDAGEATFLNEVLARVAERGGAWITFFTPDELLERLKDIGFSSMFVLSPEESLARYFLAAATLSDRRGICVSIKRES
jgi:O-methyltransferase involved in polyketide biosynthesis